MMQPQTIAKIFLLSALIALPGPWRSSGRVAAESNEPHRPNIVFIITDDQGYGDLGVHGNPIVRTPRIDALAAESASMSQFYVSPVCSPTRAALMTGRYPYRTRVIDTFKGRSMMDTNEITIAEMLRSVGYTTGLFGKWHLGDNYPLRPMEQGFDEVWMHRGGGLAQPSEPLANQRRYTNPILFHNGTAVQTRGYCTDVYFDRAIEFIDASTAAQKPFFTYIATNAPHGPFHDVPNDKLAYYQSQDLTEVGATTNKHQDTVARVFAMVENIDDNVGRLLDHLDSQELSDSTIVIFMVDNGPNSPRYVGPFREHKGHVHEGGIRSPFYFRWPQRIEPGHVSDVLSGHIDVFPTLATAAGADLPDDRTIDGRNLLPALTGNLPQWPDDRAMVLQVHRGNRPIARHHFGIRTRKWKLVRSTGFQNELPKKDIPVELYHADIDPGEMEEVSKQYPEVVSRLQKRYQDWFEDVSTTRPDNFDPPRIIIGNAAEPTTVLTIQDWRVAASARGWGSSGAWHCHVERAGTASVRVQLSDATATEPDGCRVRLTLTSQTESKTTPHHWMIQPNHDAASETISLPSGDITLSLEIENVENGKRVVPHSLVIEMARET